MDPTEITSGSSRWPREFSDIAEIVNLPNKTNGYQRQAKAMMARHDRGAPNAGQAGNLTPPRPQQAVISSRWPMGHEGGNDLSAPSSATRARRLAADA